MKNLTMAFFAALILVSCSSSEESESNNSESIETAKKEIIGKKICSEASDREESFEISENGTSTYLYKDARFEFNGNGKWKVELKELESGEVFPVYALEGKADGVSKFVREGDVFLKVGRILKSNDGELYSSIPSLEDLKKYWGDETYSKNVFSENRCGLGNDLSFLDRVNANAISIVSELRYHVAETDSVSFVNIAFYGKDLEDESSYWGTGNWINKKAARLALKLFSKVPSLDALTIMNETSLNSAHYIHLFITREDLSRYIEKLGYETIDDSNTSLVDVLCYNRASNKSFLEAFKKL